MLNPFEKKPFVLDISDFSIELLQLKKSFGGKISLENFGRTKLDEGTIRDGKVIDRGRFEERLKELISAVGINNLGTKKVIFSLPESKTFLHVFSLPPDIPKKQLPHTLESQAFKTIPLTPEEVYFDFQVVSQKKERQKLLYVAAPREIVDDYIQIFRGLGLEPLALDAESASLGRALKGQASPMGSTLIIDIGARKTAMTVLRKGNIRMSSVVFEAGNHFDKQIAQDMNIPLRKAEMLRRRHGLKKEGKGKEVAPLLEKALSEILGKAERLISFYEKRMKKKIEKVLLAGGCSLMPGMPAYFSENLGISTDLADPSLNLPELKKILEEKPDEKRPLGHQKFHPVLFANAAGLALRAVDKKPEKTGINLVPPEKRAGQPTFISRELNENKIFNIVVGIFTAVNLIFFWWVVYQYIYKAIVGPAREERPAVEQSEEQFPPEESEEQEQETEETPPEESEEQATSSPEAETEIAISILNGSGVPGEAGRVASLLDEETYEIVSIGNADSFDYQETIIRFKREREEEAGLLREVLGAGKLEENENQDEEIVIILGEDLALE